MSTAASSSSNRRRNRVFFFTSSGSDSHTCFLICGEVAWMKSAMSSGSICERMNRVLSTERVSRS
jgi:hypothetical protein